MEYIWYRYSNSVIRIHTHMIQLSGVYFYYLYLNLLTVSYHTYLQLNVVNNIANQTLRYSMEWIYNSGILTCMHIRIMLSMTMEIGRRGSEHINCVSCKIAYNIFDAEHNKLSSHTVTTSNQRRYSRFV